MIDEFFQKEKEDIELKLKEYEQFEKGKKEDIEKIHEEVNRIENEIDELEKEIQKQRSYLTPVKKFNLFERIFSREYRTYKKGRDNNPKIRDEKRKLEEKVEELKKQKNELEREEESVTKKISEIDYKDLTEKLQKLNDRKKAIHYLFSKYPELGKDIEFLKEAIEEDLVCIIYDQTNDVELYKIFLNKIIKDFPNLPEAHKSSIEKVLEEFDNPKEVEPGRYKIPHKYICEDIRKQIRDNFAEACKYENDKAFIEENGRVRNPDEYSQIENIQFHIGDCVRDHIFSCDGKYSKEFGEQLEELYSREDTYLCIHGDIKENVESIMTEGLRYTQGAESFDTKCTSYSKEKLSFIEALTYSYRPNNITVICLIPKNGLEKSNSPIGIWGSDNPDPENINYKRKEKQVAEAFILPKYVYGYLTPEEEGAERKIIKNTHENETQYKYTYYDVSTGEKNEVQIEEQER